MPAGSHLSPSANNRQPHDPDCCVLDSIPPSPHNNTHKSTSHRLHPTVDIRNDVIPEASTLQHVTTARPDDPQCRKHDETQDFTPNTSAIFANNGAGSHLLKVGLPLLLVSKPTTSSQVVSPPTSTTNGQSPTNALIRRFCSDRQHYTFPPFGGSKSALSGPTKNFFYEPGNSLSTTTNGNMVFVTSFLRC